MNPTRPRRLFLFFLVLFLPLCALSPAAAPVYAKGQARLTSYFANWDVYTDASRQVKNLPWDQLDCVNHAFWKIIPQNGGFAIAPTDPWADTDTANPKAHFPQYAACARQHPQVDILLSIGGWTCSGQFSAMCLTKESRASFIASCIDTLKTYPFLTGLDLDWEYPGVARKGSGKDEGNPVLGDDKANFPLLLKELRSALDEQFGQGKKSLTICAAASPEILSHQDWAAIHPLVDAINLMTYDMTGVSSPITGHHAPLYGSPSADEAVKYLLRQGVPAACLCIGAPLYSHGWKNVDVASSPLGASGTGVSKGGTRLYRDIQKLEAAAVPVGVPGWHMGYDEEAKAAYLWNDDPTSPDDRYFLTYESSRSLDDKLRYIRAHSLGGLIVWQSGGDGAGYPMLTQCGQSLHP